MDSALDLVRQALAGQNAKALGAQLGLDPEQASDAATGAASAILAGLAGNARSSSGAESLARALGRDHDGSILDQALSSITGRAGEGEQILGHVFGGRRPSVEAGVAKTAGLDGTQAAQLLALVAPLVMGALSKVQGQKQLDPGGLAGHLQQERASLGQQGGLAGALGSLLDRDGDGSVVDDLLEMGGGLSGLFGGKKS